MSNLPVVAIPCIRFEVQGAIAHTAKHQYILALLEAAKCMPLLIPSIGKDFNLRDIAGRIDGVLLTGASSNVSPDIYGAEREFAESELDKDRDETNLPLIRAAIEMDIPLFAICRGFQEMNVACGGTLHQYLHKNPGKFDHRNNRDLPIKEQYELHRHKISAQKGGLFERLGLPAEFSTNSLHQQGVNKLAPGFFVEGISEDGLIEAFSVPQKRFIMGTQWHPEGDFSINPVSRKLFEAFGEVLRGR